MRFVQSPTIRPNHCAVFPHLGSRHHKGYFDSERDLAGFDNRVYVSVEAAEHMARQLNWSSPQDVNDLKAELLEAQVRIEELEAQVTESDQELQAVYTLKQRGWNTSAKPGPKAAVSG